MATQQQVSETFDNTKFTELYKKAEMITGPYAKQMIEQARAIEYIENNDQVAILDTACGTGVVSSLIVSSLAASSRQTRPQLTCADISKSMVTSVKQRIELEKWSAVMTGSVSAIKADAIHTGLPSDQFNFVFFNFGPGLMPSAQKAIAECFRLLHPGGVFGCTSWVDLPWIREMRECWDAYPQAHPGQQQELPHFPSQHEFLDSFSPDGHNWAKADQVKKRLEESGFVDVKTTYTSGHTVMERYKEWADMISGSLGMVFSQCWTAAEKEAWRDEATRWTQEWMNNKYGEAQIKWEWRAIVTTARKPV